MSSTRSFHLQDGWLLPIVVVLAVAGSSSSGRTAAPPADEPERRPVHHEFSISAHDYTFTPPRLDVRQHDIVKVIFHSADIAHSFAIDAYRISKRAAAGQTITFEFHAGQAGAFPIYCNLADDNRCRGMGAELLVNPASSESE